MATFTHQRTICDECHPWQYAALDGPCIHYPAPTGGAEDGPTLSYVIVPMNAHHATATVESVGYDADARWDAISRAMLAEGWRLMGWRNYATGDTSGVLAYRTTADLFRTAEDVRSGAIQTELMR